LASRGESAAHKIIQKTLVDTEWNVFANVSVQRVLDKEERLSPAEFDLFTRGSFDFVVCDADYEPVIAFEFDGFGHDDPRQLTRDLIKNALCARAGLPLLRIGADDLREREETSALEWLCTALVALDHELDADLDDDADDEGGPSDDEPADDDDLDDVIGEPGVEMEHPFPDTALVATRLMERYGIGVGELSPLIALAGTRYLVQLRWPPAFQPPRFRKGPASEYVISEVEFAVAKVDRPDEVLFGGIGRAEFAWAHRLPADRGAEASLGPIAFPWDAYGVSMQLAEFDALRRVEGWAHRSPLFALPPS